MQDAGRLSTFLLRKRVLLSAITVVAAACVAAVALSSELSSKAVPRGAVVLDQQEIGTYEAAYDPHEELAVDNEYEAAMPFRDPGHISRAEIRLAHALARSGTTARDDTWSFIKPLWGKYIQAMRDPTDVQIGWTNPRHLSKDADFLQTAVERHAYGAEGHREPERGFDVGEPASGAGFEWARDLRNGLGMEKPTEGFQSAMPHMMSERRRERRGGESAADRRHAKKPSKLETQVQDLHKMLESESRSVRGLSDEVRELGAEKRAAKDDALRQQLTYKVLKDKLVHARLKAKIAEEKARRAEKASDEHETAEVRALLAQQTAQMKSMQDKLTSLARAKASAEKHHHSRLSSKDAQKDLSQYFSRLDRQEAKEEVAEAKAKLAKLTGLLGVSVSKGHNAADADTHTHAPTSSLSASGKSGKRRTHRGSLLEATSLFSKGSDAEYGLEEAKSPRQAAKAKEQELAIVDEPSDTSSSLDSLVQQLKADTSNEAPYLPL